ncbi:MAG: transketolase [Phycisphaerae bacterium]|nr:transketolase [Phycisphaerae bacterium]
MPTEKFPIDLSALKPLKLDLHQAELTDQQRADLKFNIQLCRDAIVFFTALAGAKGLSGHTGGAYDTVPEVMIIRGFIAGGAPIVPIFYDEAGHRVATQYLLSVLNGDMPAEKLLHYREYNQGLPGHPEKLLTPGVEFSSGRLGHMWAFCNGVAMANPGKAVVVLGSDGSQMEGDNAEAARLAVGRVLNVKMLIDDNNVTISGHPQTYMSGYDLTRTLSGYGYLVDTTMGEDIDALYVALTKVFGNELPHGLVIKREMAPGIEGAEGSPHAHEVLKVDTAVKYLEKRGGYEKAIEMLKSPQKQDKSPITYKGSSGAGKNRDDFGKIINEILDGMSEKDRLASVRVFDCDLAGSQGLHHIQKKHPEVFVQGGIMERGNFSAAAGFGYTKGKQGIFSTFSAFLEMCISEITMSRLNFANVIAHFSHSGCDDMADNTCHFGINSMYADGGVAPGHGDDMTRLYFPADQHQFAACVKTIFKDPGLRFVFSNRAAVPDILGEDGKPLYAGKPFEAGKDSVVRDAKGGGYVVAFGECVYRALDAVITAQEGGTKVGLINKSTLNVWDEATMKQLAAAPFVLVVEGWNVKTGLGSRFGSELLKRGFKGKYNNIGTHKEGSGGLWQQMGYQGLDPKGIGEAIKALA